MKNIRLWSFLLIFVVMEAILFSLAAWQHGRMLEKMVLEHKQKQKIGIQTELNLQPEKAIFLLHQKQGEKGVWRYLVPILEEEMWLDLGVLDPQRDKLNPNFTAYNKTKYVGNVVKLETPKQTGWLKSPVETAHPRVWNRLDTARIGPTYFAAQHQIYPSISAILPQGLTAKKHQEYRNTWMFLAIILLIFCAFFVKSIKSKNN